MDNSGNKMAKRVYETICAMFDEKGLHCERRDDDLVVSCTARGEDIPMEIYFAVLSQQQIIQLMSPMPFIVPEDKRVDMALAITVVNNDLADGSFDFDLDDGRIFFRLTSSYRDSILSKALFEYMLMVSASTIDEYNDKFLMISKGYMSFEQFKESRA